MRNSQKKNLLKKGRFPLPPINIGISYLLNTKPIPMHFAGAQIGNVVSMGASGLLIHYLGGWTSVFYTFGVLGLAWLCLWMSFASSDPDQCSRLSEYERKYLLATMGHLKQKTKQVGRGCQLPDGFRNR